MCKFAVYSNSPLLPPKKNKIAPVPVGFHFSIFLGRWSSVVIEKVGVPLRRLRGRGQGSLGALTLGSQATDSALGFRPCPGQGQRNFVATVGNYHHQPH